jgi:hypothetical protein
LFKYPLRTSKTITNLPSCKDQQVDEFWEETVESFVDVWDERERERERERDHDETRVIGC